MAISTMYAFLMMGSSSGSTGTLTYSKLVDIKDFPDLGGAPEMIDTTTLTDRARTFIPGIENLDQFQFTANFDKTDFSTLKALETAGDAIPLAVWFGGTESGGEVTPTGANGKFTFEAYINVYPAGGGVNEVVDMIISVTPKTVITFSAS